MGASPHMFGQINPSTWVSQTQTPPVIEEFLDHYSQTHYHALANRAKELIEEELTNPEWHDIHVNVRCRAKTPKSLAEKLKIRHADHPYEKESDIWDDVHDLAGVRVILYMPSEDQREKVQRVIQAIWGDDVQQKYHEGSEDRLKVDERARLLQAPAEREKLSTKKQYRPRHLGYIAVHYRPKMKQSHHKRDKYFWEPKDRVEIQVVSALSHAWAEAGHDTLYKSYAYGPPTLHEEMLLDSLNGLVLSGELILQQFHELVMKRTSTPFRHRGDFGVFIRELDILQPHEGCTDHSYQDFEVESLDILLRFLIKTGKAYPLAVRNALKELGFPKEPKLDFIMAQEIKPSFKPAQGMTTTICLLRILMPPCENEAKAITPRSQCHIMMHALILLQSFFGSADSANAFLRDCIKMSDRARESIDFVLSSCRRQLLLNKESEHTFLHHYEEKINDDIEPAWNWFQAEAVKPKSICGIVFRLAEMGATKDMEWFTMLEKLKIGTILSRSSTSSMEDDLDV